MKGGSSVLAEWGWGGYGSVSRQPRRRVSLDITRHLGGRGSTRGFVCRRHSASDEFDVALYQTQSTKF
eukprot:scaffold649551_cov41-Prasinocladus_malaysianus.AAC.1